MSLWTPKGAETSAARFAPESSAEAASTMSSREMGEKKYLSAISAAPGWFAAFINASLIFLLSFFEGLPVSPWK